MDKFCGSTFWDWDLTWKSETPDLTPCFQKTVLIWTPCIFYWIFFILDLDPICNSSSNSIRNYGYSQIPSSQRPKVHYNGLNLGKLLILVLLVVLQIARLSETLVLQLDGYAVYGVDTYTPIIQLFTYVLAAVAVIIAKNQGILALNLQFAFWVLSALAGFFPFRTAVLEALRSSSFWNETETLIILGLIEYPLIIGQLLLNCWADVDVSQEAETSKRYKPCPRKWSSSLSKLLFWWFDPLTWKGFRNPLELKDLWKLDTENDTTTIVGQFAAAWRKRALRARSAAKPGTSIFVGVVPVLFSAFGWTFCAGGFLKAVLSLLAFVSPQVLNLLIDFVNNPSDQAWKGYVYAIALFVTSVVFSLLNAHYLYMMYALNLRVKAALVSAIYRKALVISNMTRKESTIGEIVNLMSVDVQKVLDVLPYLHMIWSSPLQIGLALFFLWQILGPSVLAGVGVIVIIIPLNGIMGGYVRRIQVEQMKNKDERVKTIAEILGGIKILKLYGWEPSFQKRVLNTREKEIKSLYDLAYLNSFNDFLWICSQFMVALATFGTYVFVDDSNILDAQTAFVSMALLQVMTQPLTAFPMVVIWSVQAGVSLKRINKFMNAEEMDLEAIRHDLPEGKDHPIFCHDASFSWESPQGAEVLKNLNLRIPKNSLTAIVGTVGSGKSSLLSALLGELYKTNGLVNVRGSISYVSQQAWIQNATLKSNVLFGRSYDPMSYDKIIAACCLLPDLEVLPGRDGVEIGEKGINLSGGQKQRVSIARAAYSNSDLYLLDDPLSAVDPHVGRHIFDKVIGPQGILKRKTRVLVTHSLTFLPQADNIIVMKDGEISEVGQYHELLENKGEFAQLVATYSSEEQTEEGADGGGSEDSSSSKPVFYVGDGDSVSEKEVSDVITPEQRLKKRLSRQMSTTGTTQQELQKLIHDETSETKGVSWRIYFEFFKAGGWNRCLPALFMYFMYQGFELSANFWLNIWTAEPIVNGTQANRETNLGIYAGLGLGQCLTFFTATLVSCLALVRSSSAFHDTMLHRILRAPMSFFDTTPAGRILNRFSRDLDILDNTISYYIRTWLTLSTSVLGTIVVIMYTTPIFGVVLLPLAAFYYVIQRFFIPTSRQLKRLESVTRSPIFSHFEETLAGAATIRAYGAQARFVEESDEKLNTNQICLYPSIVSARWLGVRLEFIGNLIILFASIFAALSRDVLSPGLVGLSISYALQVNSLLGYVIRFACDIEANIVAAERIQEYAVCPQEAPWKALARSPPKTWPAYGSLRFKNYSTRYRQGLELVLKDVSLLIEPGEKVGIVGRTGAGKSSLTLALFRIIEATKGSIEIDGEDLSHLGLHDIRSRLTIIPQDPVLFSGSMRFNLDPFKHYSDAAVWKALESANLKKFVAKLPGKLGFVIAEGGSNLSVGQKQLVCLARALLRGSKILILDEATASVDLETDDLIQKTIRVEFENSTIITIAHRINTIMDYTRIVVFESGRIAETGTPEELLKDKNSIFCSMASEAGISGGKS